jgi:hypothetical protein
MPADLVRSLDSRALVGPFRLPEAGGEPRNPGMRIAELHDLAALLDRVESDRLRRVSPRDLYQDLFLDER